MDRNSAYLAVKYFLAAELYRRGYSVAVLQGNAKAVDLMVVTDNGKSLNIQVNAIQSKKRNVYWNINMQDVKDDILYVFIDLRCDALKMIPNFYIGSGSEIKLVIQMSKAGRSYIDVSVIHDDRFLNRWDKLD